MKKIRLFPSLLLTAGILSSCHYFTWEREPNPIVEGSYSCVNDSDETQTIHLNVKKISEEEFKQANGIDVLTDFFLNNHYYLECFLSYEDDTKEELHFYKLKGGRDGSVGGYVTYKDDQNSWIWPSTESLDVPGNFPIYIFNYSPKYSKKISGNLVYMEEEQFSLS